MAFLVSYKSTHLIDNIEKISKTARRPARPLHLQALLQLPQFADADGIVTAKQAIDLLSALAIEIPLSSEWDANVECDTPAEMEFRGQLPADEVTRILTHFHYLRSPRTDGRSYGLFTRKGRIAAICYVSPLDVPKLINLLDRECVSAETTMVVSRVFAFRDAPKNSISYLLSRVGHAERAAGVKDFVTYVNPYMGFSGTSYRAAGWKPLGQEEGTKFRYLDQRYITDRALARQFGPQEDDSYRRMLGSRFSTSIMPLPPLSVFQKSLSS